MKFEKFVKKVGANGRIYKDKVDNQWLNYGGVLMLIPNGYNVLSAFEVVELPERLEELIDSTLKPAYLDRAILPKADSKAKDIKRVYTDVNGKNDVFISNEQWALIEAYDRTYIGEITNDDGDVIHHLLVTDEYDDEDFDIKMIVLDNDMSVYDI